MTRVAIIGAGFAGLACAKALRTAGVTPAVFDKGRGPGGRAATRRADGGWQFDHGLPHLQAASGGFDALLEAWRTEGRVAPWSGRFGVIGASGFVQTGAPLAYVGVPKMNAAIAPDSSDVAFGEEVAGVGRGPDGWSCETKAQQRHGPFDIVLLAIPAPQAVPLLAHAPDLAEQAAQARYRPRWTGMLAFEAAFGAPFDAAALKDHDVLSWIARDTGKPGRPSRGETWVVHASDAWTRDHLEDDKDVAANALLEAFTAVVAGLGADVPSPVLTMAHRWRYALVEQPVGVPALFDAERGLGACGDWCLGPDVADAWRSGQALADLVMHAVRA